MKIGVLTSSRADYGIYKPLLMKLKMDVYFELEIIVFGMHLSKKHGYTINEILLDNYNSLHKLETQLENDNVKSIAKTYANTCSKFATLWSENRYDLVFALGDRFEMSAAIQASIPFQISIAHIHGGETTLGAIDNIYRHQITLASKLHFTSTNQFKNRVVELIENENFVFNVGSLSLEKLETIKFLEECEFRLKYNLNNTPFILVTFHPETMNLLKQKTDLEEMEKALKIISKNFQLVITMPNADTNASLFKEKIELLNKENENIVLVDNFGAENYFNALHYSICVLGNSSSGIVEAASFKKYVVNVGDRQKGRLQNKNMINVPFNKTKIVEGINTALSKGIYLDENVYFQKNVSANIIEIIKKWNSQI